ncbi:MAG: hypothetical protein AB7I27_04810 [Bacteriovoracaceae bacterium]
MNIKLHYIVTFTAFCFLGVMVARPEMFSQKNDSERICKLEKGKVECAQKYTEYKINHPDITYE